MARFIGPANTARTKAKREARLASFARCAAHRVRFGSDRRPARAPPATITSRWVRFEHSVSAARGPFQAVEEFLHSSDFCLGARCAPERAKAQRAAPFGKLETIGFVLYDFFWRARTAPIPSR